MMNNQGAYIFGCAGPQLSDEEADFFAQADPWGFILFARNIEDPNQLRALTANLRGSVRRNAPIFIDQEGGRVARMKPPHWREWLPALDQVRMSRRGAKRAMYLRYRLIAEELRAVGIDANCAPLADVANRDTHPILMNRCYGDDVVKVAELGVAVATALLDGGVLPVVKHIPGHGRATTDSHLELPRVREKFKTLRWSDFLAFEPFADMPMAMTAHVVYEAIDAERPATQSPDVIAMIRDELEFAGLLMSDDISMQALSGPIGLRARTAVRAGCDLVLQCNGVMEEMVAVADGVGAMSEAAQARADAALTWRLAPQPIDIKAAEAEFHALMTGQMVYG